MSEATLWQSLLLKLSKCSHVSRQPARETFRQIYGWGGLRGACPQGCSLLQGWIEVAWPLRIESLLGLVVFTRAELRQEHDAALVNIALSAGA